MRSATMAGCLMLGLLSAAAAADKTPPPDFVMSDSRCTVQASVVGRDDDPKIGEGTVAFRFCWRKKDTFGCTQVAAGKDDKSKLPHLQLQVAQDRSPRMFLVGVDSSVMVTVDWSVGQYALAATVADPENGAVIQKQCVGTIVNGTEFLKQMQKSGTPP